MNVAAIAVVNQNVVT